MIANKFHTAEIIRRWLFSLGVILILSLTSFLVGEFLAEHQSNQWKYEQEAQSLSGEVHDLQVELGYKKPTEECVESIMNDWKPNGNFISRRDAKSRAQSTCSTPMAMSDEYVVNETPEHFQEIWFRRNDVWERSQSPLWMKEMLPYKKELRQYGMIGLVISMSLFGLTFFLRWLFVGRVRRID